MYASQVFLLALASTSIASNIYLPSYPLAVKTPYLSTWLPGNESHSAATAQPRFWQWQPLTWMVMARIDGETYKLFGCPDKSNNASTPQQMSLDFTSTHTTIVSQADSATITLDFFSPVDPDDYVRQSLPFSYLTVSVSGAAAPSVDIFSAIDGSWTGQDAAPRATQQEVGDIQMFTLSPNSPILFGEADQMSQWGETVFASSPASVSSNMSCAYGTPGRILSAFDMTGVLPSGANNVSATFVVGLYHDEVINYAEVNGNVTQVGYYRSQFNSLQSALKHVFEDYDAALAQSAQLDENVMQMGNQVSANYSDILEFSVRQSFGGLEVTIPGDTLDPDQAIAFMKEISTDGNVNTIADLLPKAAPIFYALAPDYMRLLMEPVLKWSQHSWPLSHTVHDIGKHYPNASGETPCEEEFLALDSTTVIFWMVHAHELFTGDTQWADQYSSLLRRYADYNVQYGLYPVLQRSSVDSIGAAANQTALAVSAAIALNAYGTMTGLSNYSQIAKEFAVTIMDVGMDAEQTHFLVHYDDPDDSWLIMYPLAFDRLLDLETFPYSLDDTLSQWYSQHERPAGLPFSSEVDYTLMEFEMWAAATSSLAVRDFFVDTVHQFLTHETHAIDSVPGPTQWNVTGGIGMGEWVLFSKAKSIVGSTFMIAAMQNANKTVMQKPSTFAPRANYRQMESDMDTNAPGQFKRRFSLIGDSSSKSINVSTGVPQGLSKTVHPSFAGLSIEITSALAFLGNSSIANPTTKNLLQQITSLTGGNITIRISGSSAQNVKYDLHQTAAISPGSPPNTCSTAPVTLGPSFYTTFTLYNSTAVNWIYALPFSSSPNTLTSAVAQSQSFLSVVGSHFYAFAIGDTPYAYDPPSHGCQNYSVSWFAYANAVSQNNTQLLSQGNPIRAYEAPNLPTGPVGEKWTAEQCFTGGLDAMKQVKTYASHYYRYSSSANVSVQDLLNDAGFVRGLGNIQPQIDYLNDIYSCVPYVLSEVAIADAQTACQSPDMAMVENSLGAAVWYTDFLLYAMANNVSQVYLHQALVAEGGSIANGALYALLFTANFLGNATGLQVAVVQRSETFTTYAGFEEGKLTVMAMVNRDYYSSSTGRSATSRAVTLPDSVKSVEITSLTGTSSVGSNIMWDGVTWDGNNGMSVKSGNGSKVLMLTGGVVDVDVEASEALLLKVRY